MLKLLTIVVPVYKVEPYINKCLDSCILEDEKLMSQLEVIIVNDGTPDNSAEMSREYVKRYPQTFRQIDKENGGHGSAWNVGLKEASGKYLRFLDSDDWLSNLDKLMAVLAKTDADLVFTHMNRFYANRKENILDSVIDDFNIAKPLNAFPFEKNSHHVIFTFWFATYKREILQFEGRIFSEKTMYDDALLFALPAIKAKTYICLDYVVYNYFIGRADQSFSLERVPKNIIARAKQAIYAYTFWNDHKPFDINTRIQEEVMHYLYHNAWNVFNTIPIISYTQAKEVNCQMHNLLLYFSSDSKNFKRYTHLPFCIYYLLNRIRHFMGKI